MKTPLCIGLLSAALAAHAVDGDKLIDQNKALNGGVTADDEPGFPVTISEPGSYRLAGNLVVPPGVGAVRITSPNVTLDLNGFAIRGPLECTPPNGCPGVPLPEAAGVRIALAPGQPVATAAVALRNGVIRGMPGHGISATSLPVTQGVLVENMHVIGNGAAGIFVNGAVVRHSLVLGNRQAGIAGGVLVLNGNLVSRNFFHGADVGPASLSENVILFNGADGMSDLYPFGINGDPLHTGGNVCANHPGCL